MQALATRDDPHGVNDAWNVSTQGQQDVKPECSPKTYLHKNTKRGE